jgi:predicted RecB family nuclease
VCGIWSTDGGCEKPEECAEESRRMYEEMQKAEEEWIRQMTEYNEQYKKGLAE